MRTIIFRALIILGCFLAALFYARCSGAFGQSHTFHFDGRIPGTTPPGYARQHGTKCVNVPCPPGQDCSTVPIWAQAGAFGRVTASPGKVTVRGGLGGASIGMIPVTRSGSVVPVFFGENDPIPGAGIYIGVIRGRGITITAWHMAKHGVRRVLGKIPTGITRDKLGYDLAAVMTDPLNIPQAVLASEARTGESVSITGYPRGRVGTRRSRVIGFFLPEAGQAWGDLMLEGASAPGDSGGPITDENGQIVGMLWGTAEDKTSAAVSVTAIADFLRRVDVMLGGMDENGDGAAEPDGASVPGLPVTPPVPSANIIAGGLPVDSARPGVGGDGAIPFGVADRFDRLEALIAANAAATQPPISSSAMRRGSNDAIDHGGVSDFTKPVDGPVAPSLMNAAIPAILAGLGWTGPPALAAVVGLKVLSAIIRRRRGKRRSGEAADAADEFPDPEPAGSIPRDDEEARQILQLSRLEGRSPLHDAIVGRIAFDELDKAIDSEPDGSAADWARKLRRRLEDRFNEMAPPAVYSAAGKTH